MVRVPIDVTATERMRWLAELSHALEEAEKLVWRLGATGLRNPDALDACARIETARAEVRSLHLGQRRERGVQLDPIRTNPAVWNNRERDRA